MTGIVRWIGLDLANSRAARMPGADERVEFDGTTGDAASETPLKESGDIDSLIGDEAANASGTRTMRPDGDVRPMGPGMLGPTLGPCRARSINAAPITNRAIDAIHHHRVNRRRSRADATSVNLLAANSTSN
jgi:hypothetical protein